MTDRLRFMIMVGVNAVCVLIATAALVGDLRFHLAWGLPIFAGSVVIGFAAQIWFIVGLARAGRLGKGV